MISDFYWSIKRDQPFQKHCRVSKKRFLTLDGQKWMYFSFLCIFFVLIQKLMTHVSFNLILCEIFLNTFSEPKMLKMHSLSCWDTFSFMISYSKLKLFKIGSTCPWHITVKWVFGPILGKRKIICTEGAWCDGGRWTWFSDSAWRSGPETCAHCLTTFG